MSHYDDALASYPYTGFKTQGQRPIGVDAIKQGGFSVVVAGNRYGKGSSREHSPMAEKLAGIKLVIARSFERRSEAHTSELQSLMRISYAVFCLKKTTNLSTKSRSTATRQ